MLVPPLTTPSHVASADVRLAAPRRTLGSLILSYSIALPLFGRAVFPLARDKAHITLASSFTDPQIVATYLAAAVVMIQFCTTSNLLGRMERGRATQVFMLFVAMCLASSFGSRFPLFSIWRCLEVLLLGMWAVVMIRNTAGTVDPSQSIRAFYVICVAILIGVFVGLVINPSGAWSMEGDIARLTGTTGYSINPNDIGAIAALIAVGCYMRAVERGSFKYTAAAILFMGVCYVSRSRGSYIALVAGLLAANVMLGRLAHRRATIFATSFCAALALGVVVLVSPEVREFFAFLMTRGHETENLETFGGRLHVWEFGLQIFREHPFLGTGYGTYPEGVEGGHFHNVFIELLVTTGTVGVVSYVAFLVTMIASTRRWIRRANVKVVAERIIAADLVTIPVVIIVSNGASAGAAYFSWDLLGLMSVAVSSSVLMVRKNTGAAVPAAQMPFSNLLR
jgi:O-antigen ligase